MKYKCTLDDINISNEFETEMSKLFNLDRHLIRLLYSREIDNKEKLNKFLNPNINDLHDPFLFEDMKSVVGLINHHLSRGSEILIFGDYDVDGISASAILIKYFRSLNAKVSNYMPNRYEDGYGLSKETIDKIFTNSKPNLVITVDCGITAIDEIEYIKNQSVDIIVTDHHEPLDILPDCLIINPKSSKTYPFNALCGAGVAFKLVQAMAGITYVKDYMPISAIATIADIVELYDENRVIVKLGLQNMTKAPKGIIKMLSECGLGIDCKASDIAFKLAPKINASGRMGDADTSLELYMEENPIKIKKLCANIIEYNNQRQLLCNRVYDDVKAELKILDIFNIGAIICKSSEWDSGILGIVSARIAEEYHRPVFLFSQIDDELVGSCRSVNGVNIHTLLSEMAHLLTKFGGHPMAAGLTLRVDKFTDFSRLTNEYVIKNFNKADFLPTKNYDFEIDASEVTLKLVEDIERLEPCGHMNPRPVFNFKLNKATVSSLPKHPQHLLLSYPNFNLLAFNSSEFYFVLSGNTSCNLLADLTIDIFRNVKRISGIVKSIDYEDIYRPQDNDIIMAEYIKQMIYVSQDKYTFNNYNRDQLIRLLVDMDKNVNGTLIIANDYNTYINFKAIFDSNNIFKNRIFSINDETGINTILLAPINLKGFNNYSRIIFLDPVLNMGYLSEIQKNTKATIYLPHKPSSTYSLLKDVNMSRDEFGRYFRIIQFAQELKIAGYNTYDLYFKIIGKFKAKEKFNYLQFFICLNVFKELGIIETNQKDTEIIKIIDKKNLLSSSNFYNKLNIMKSNRN